MAETYPLGIQPPPPNTTGTSPEWFLWLTDVLDKIRVALYWPSSYYISYTDGDPSSHVYAQGVYHILGAISYTAGTGLLTIRGDYGFDAAGGGCTTFAAECKITKDGADYAVFTGSTVIATAAGDGLAHVWELRGKVTGAGCNIAFYGQQFVIEER